MNICHHVPNDYRGSKRQRQVVIISKIVLSTPQPPNLWGDIERIWGDTPKPSRQRGLAPCGIPIFVLHGALYNQAWRIHSKIGLSPPHPPILGGYWREMGDTPKPPAGCILHLFFRDLPSPEGEG